VLSTLEQDSLFLILVFLPELLLTLLSQERKLKPKVLEA